MTAPFEHRRTNPHRGEFDVAMQAIADAASQQASEEFITDAVRIFAKDARRAGVPFERMVMLLRSLLSKVSDAATETQEMKTARERHVRLAVDIFYDLKQS